MKYKKPLGITSEQWLSILQDTKVTNENVWRLLSTMYEYGEEINAKHLAQLMGLPNYQILNNLISIYGRHVASKHKSVDYPKNKKGKIQWWHIPFWGEQRKGFFYWDLRPELKEAIAMIYKSNLIPVQLPTELEKWQDDKELELRKQFEGGKMLVTVNKYERSPEARRICLKEYGYKCSVCDFDFEEVYGELGKGYIEVHHLKPLYTIKKTYEVDPVNDLRPVCPNCHAMIHKGNNLSIEELKAIITGNRYD